VTWNDINWRRLTFFLTLVSGAAVFLQWLFVRSWSPASVWGYLGTASIVFFVGLVAINKRLWRLRIMKWRAFGWITNMPDISGRWTLEMRPTWTSSPSFSSHAIIRQHLFSVQVEFDRKSSHSESRSASIFSTGENRWNLACVYENSAESEPEEHTFDHDGCLLVRIEPNVEGSKRMSGPYWTNKTTRVLLSQLPDLGGLQGVLSPHNERAFSGAYIQIYATSGHATFTR
jgi:hypothetical protein